MRGAAPAINASLGDGRGRLLADGVAVHEVAVHEVAVHEVAVETMRTTPDRGGPGHGAPAGLPALSARLADLADRRAAALVLLALGASVPLLGRADAPAVVAWGASAAAALAAAAWSRRALRRARAELVAAADAHERATRARAAELARLNAELARAGRHKSELFASMSHELRTPLNGILGYSRALLDGLDGELTPDQRDDVAQIHASGQGLLAIVNDVLDLSKIEAGRVALRREPFAVGPLVADVLGRVQPLAAERGLALRDAVPDDLPPLLADGNRTRQVLLNLVGNAIKFTDAGGVTVRAEARGGEVVLSVADTGIGIPAEAHALVFEPFRQADQQDTRRHGGTGLGLAICRQLVRAMGGRIWLESAVGRGTTVHVALPCARLDGPADDPTAAGRGRGGAAFVLLHDPARAAAVERGLRDAGHLPVAVADAAGLHDALLLRRPALAILDVLPAGPVGWQAFQILRADPAGRAAAVVLVAAHDGLSLALPVGPTDFLLHPGHAADLLARLDALRDPDGADAARRAPDAPPTVLVARGDRAGGDALADALRDGGYDVCRAESAAEVAALVAGRRPAAAIVDLLLPGGALAALAAIRADAGAAALPVIVTGPPTLTPGQQRALYRDTADTVLRRGAQRSDAVEVALRALPAHARPDRPPAVAEGRPA